MKRTRMMHRRWLGRKAGGRSSLRATVGGALLMVAAGCPARFDPRAEPVEQRSPDPAADQAYRDARQRFDQGDLDGAERAFADFTQKFPTDPLAPGATLWEARAAIGRGEYARASSLVEPLVGRPEGDAVGERARFLLGIALGRQAAEAPHPDAATVEGARRARTLLEPLATRIAAGDDQMELYGALAEAEAATGDLPAALATWQRYFDAARPVERTWLRQRLTAVAGAMDDAQLAAAAGPIVDGELGRAAFGGRLAAQKRAAGDAAGAARLEADTAEARRTLGFETGAGATRVSASGSAERVVGLVLPLSGRSRLLGERALRGALVAAESLPTGNGSIDLRVRDSQSSPERAAAALDELAAEGVAAVVGSPEQKESTALSQRAVDDRIPLLELAPDDAARTGPVFKLVRPSAARAEALAAAAAARGRKRVATLFPSTTYGRHMAEVFAQAARARCLAVVAELAVDERATTFIAPVKKLAEAKADALFVPAAAQQLELIASQLYATGLTRIGGSGMTPVAGARGARVAQLQLLATADGLSSRTIASSGRYLQGALLAPVFYGDAADPTLGPFVARFRALYNEDPGAADALGYDAVRAILTTFDGKSDGPIDREVVVGKLTQPSAPGLTGPLGFTEAGERAGAPTLFTVEGDAIHVAR